MRWVSALDRGPQPTGPQIGFVCILTTLAFTLVIDGGGLFLIAAHRWGGLLAFVVGLVLVAWGSRLSGSAREESGRSPPSRSAPAA